MEMKQWELQRALIVTPNVLHNGLSSFKEERLQDAIDRIDSIVPGSRQPATEMYTDRFLPDRRTLMLTE